MRYTALTQRAMVLCFQAHRDGGPYVFHPFHLAEQMDSEEAICTALLHNAVEDGGLTLADLARAGMPDRVVAAVDRLTRRPGTRWRGPSSWRIWPTTATRNGWPRSRRKSGGG